MTETIGRRHSWQSVYGTSSRDMPASAAVHITVASSLYG